LRSILPNLTYASFRRALVLLDPYGLDLEWEVMRTAGQLRTIDLFLNRPLMDMNRNVLWSNPERADPADVARMTAFWGDESWREAAYVPIPTLFGEAMEKAGPHQIVDAFCARLRKVASFAHVSRPLPMRNSSNNIVYYLVFASQKSTADNIIKDIFSRYSMGRET
jgi:three-Cys-motif partner protein